MVSLTRIWVVNIRELSTTSFDDFQLCDTSTSPRYSDKINLYYNVYPNPTENFIYIKCTDAFQENTYISIEDLSGRTLKKEELPVELNVKIINIGDLSAGLYIIKIERMDKCLFNEKLVLLR